MPICYRFSSPVERKYTQNEAQAVWYGDPGSFYTYCNLWLPANDLHPISYRPCLLARRLIAQVLLVGRHLLLTITAIALTMCHNCRQISLPPKIFPLVLVPMFRLLIGIFSYRYTCAHRSTVGKKSMAIRLLSKGFLPISHCCHPSCGIARIDVQSLSPSTCFSLIKCMGYILRYTEY